MMERDNFSVIDENTLSQISGGISMYSGGGGEMDATDGDDGGAFGVWELISTFGGR